jgi:O-antigen ligase
MGLAYLGYLYATGQTIGALHRFLILFDQADDPLLRTGANRFDYFAAAYRLWLESPIIGHGLASFAPLFAGGAERQGSYPHNAILQILAEFGIVGIVLFIVFILSGLRHINLERLHRDPLCFALVMVFMTFVVQTMAQGDFTQSYRFFFIAGLLAMRPPAEESGEEEEDEVVPDRS